MSTNKIRLYAISGAVAAITATGALYGAGLNIRQEFKQQKQEVMQSTISDRIAQMENARKKLIEQREELQAKIERLESGQSPVSPNDDKILPKR